MNRYTPERPVHRPPVLGETTRERSQRLAANKADRDAWHRYGDARCATCDQVRFHVSHEMDPEHSPEGAAYHAEFAHHAFVEPVR